MRSSSVGRRSSVIPVRVSMFDKDDKNAQMRTDPRKTAIKSKSAAVSAESSHIPRPRTRSSCELTSVRKSTIKVPGRTPSVQHGPMTPVTPVASGSRYGTSFVDLSRNKSPAGDRISNIGARGPRKDTRPINDKAYQTFMLNKIDKFFHNIQCTAMLNSNGSLKPITLKMFVEVLAFLLKYLDVKQTLTLTNYVDQLPEIVKKLRYPGTVNKSWLKTANAMHSWPNVLALLSWLVHICEIKDLASQTYELDNLPFVGDEKYAEFQSYKFLSLFKLYAAWNDERLDDESALINEFLHKIEINEEVTEEDKMAASKDLEAAMAKHRSLEEDSKNIDDECEELRKMLLSLEEDETKQAENIKAKEEYLKNVRAETNHLKKDYKTLQEQIQLKKVLRGELKTAIKKQPMTKDERDKIAEEYGTTHNYLQQFNEHLEEMQKELYTLELKLGSTKNNLSKKMLSYNREISKHLPKNVSVDLEELIMPEGSELKPDIMEILHAKSDLMNNVKESLKEQSARKEQLYKSDYTVIENLQKQKKNLEREYKNVVDEVQQKEVHINEQMLCLEMEGKTYEKQIKQLRNEISDIQKHMPSTQALISEVEEAKDKLAAVCRKKEHLEELLKSFFTEFYSIIGARREELASALKKGINKKP